MESAVSAWRSTVVVFGLFEVLAWTMKCHLKRARQILDVLTQGGSMAHINTPLALRLMPLAQELGERELVEQLLDHASSVASDVLEEGWTRFEAMKLMETPIGGYLRLAEGAEGMDGAEALAAAVHHHIALIYLSEGQLDEARATAQRPAVASNDGRPPRHGLRHGVADDHRQAAT